MSAFLKGTFGPVAYIKYLLIRFKQPWCHHIYLLKVVESRQKKYYECQECYGCIAFLEPDEKEQQP